MEADAVGRAWGEFCDALRAAGEELRGPDFPADPAARAEGYRHLSRLAVMALQSYVEFGDADFPAFHRYDDDAVKWGGPNVDNQYLRARVDPCGTYRIVGDVTDVRDLIVSTHEGDMALEQYGVYEERQLEELTVGTDGRLELVLGGPEVEGNWIPLDPSARMVMVRVYVADWLADGLPWFDVERLDRVEAGPEPLDPVRLAAALADAGDWVDRSQRYWRDYLETSPVRGLINRLSPPRGVAGGSDRIGYGAGWWELDPDGWLLVEFPDPKAEYWSFLLYSTPWFESLDVRNRLVSASNVVTPADPDGVVRLVIGGRDPGIANWLDTEGRRAGMLSYRLIGAQVDVAPMARVVQEIGDEVAGGRVDAAARREQVRARRAGIARRFHR